jgi:hypothetical protein
MTAPGKGAVMKIDKDQILNLIRQFGDKDKAGEAEQTLPQEVDTDNSEHANMLSRFGLDPAKIEGLLGKLPGGLGDKLGNFLK